MPQKNGDLVSLDEDLFLGVLRDGVDNERVALLFLALGNANQLFIEATALIEEFQVVDQAQSSAQGCRQLDKIRSSSKLDPSKGDALFDEVDALRQVVLADDGLLRRGVVVRVPVVVELVC